MATTQQRAKAGADRPVVVLGVPLGPEQVGAASPPSLLEQVRAEPQKAFPLPAKDPGACARIETAVRGLQTVHRLHNGDSRAIELEPESVDLVLTSPPYWTLKKYNDHERQLGEVEDYDEFLDELDEVWRRAYNALIPGGRMVIVVGDVNVSRKVFGHHLVFPLHASIQERCRQIGFDNLAPIIWYKIANAQYEVGGGGGFFGKPYEPNGVIKNDIEYILFQRKPGGYRKPELATRPCRSSPLLTMSTGFNRFGGSVVPQPAIILRRSLWHSRSVSCGCSRSLAIPSSTRSSVPARRPRPLPVGAGTASAAR